MEENERNEKQKQNKEEEEGEEERKDDFRLWFLVRSLDQYVFLSL